MADSLQANLDRAAGYLKRFQSKLVPHFIAGEPVPSASSATFDTLDPATNEKQATVASGDGKDIDRAAAAEAAAFRIWRDISGANARSCTPSQTRSRRAPTKSRSLNPPTPANRFATWRRQRCAAREFPLLRRPRARRRRRPLDAGRRSPQLFAAPADRPRRRHHAVEHAVHAVDVEDRARARRGLHGRPQARRMEPAFRRAARRRSWTSRSANTAAPSASSIACTVSAKAPARR